MAFPLGNLSALRTFRVLRALKTVAVVPGNVNRLNYSSWLSDRIRVMWRANFKTWSFYYS